MRKTDLLILFILLPACLTIICSTGECADYVVPNFLGGINVSGDSTDLAPNQALDLTNLTFDMPNVLTNREGYSFWNDSAFDGANSSHPQQIIIYNNKIVVGIGDFVYISPSLADPGTIEWDTTRMHWTGDSIIVTNDSDTLYDIGSHDYWYMKGNMGDSIDLAGTRYKVGAMSTDDDTTIDLSINYAGSTDTLANYTVYKRFESLSSMAEYNDYLYVMSNNIYDGFATIYNDTVPKFLAVIDTGTITSALNLDTSTFVVSGDDMFLRSHTNKCINWDFDHQLDGSGMVSGDIFFYYYQWQHNHGGTIKDGIFYSKIDSVDTTTMWDYIFLEDRFTPWNKPITPGNPWEVRREATVPVIDSNYGGLADANKNWFDIEFGDRLFTGFYAVISDSGYDAIRTIYNNDDTILVVDGYISDDQPYYIMTGIPTYLIRNDSLIDSLWKEQPRFKQIIFYDGQLYAIGTYYGVRDPVTGQYPNPFQGETNYYGFHNRVWYSHPGFPNYITRDYYFELGSDERGSILFILRGRLFIGTTEGIWTSNGMPKLVNTIGDQIYEKIVSNQGIPDLDNWTKATEEYGYFTNRTGVYRFDGVRPEKISHLVDPIIENNYNSRIVMGYLEPDLYISFTDSNFTLVYDERFKSFTKLDFGMTCIYAPADTNIIYFGLHGQNGRVYYYPNGEYWDRNSPTDSSGIAIEYKSGWQTFAGYDINKKLKEGYFPMLAPDTATIAVYSNFSGTADGTATTDSSGRFVYRKPFGNDAVGEYFQVAINDTIDGQIIIGGYKLIWDDADQWKK